jgi:hypothetical protein
VRRVVQHQQMGGCTGPMSAWCSTPPVPGGNRLDFLECVLQTNEVGDPIRGRMSDGRAQRGHCNAKCIVRCKQGEGASR